MRKPTPHTLRNEQFLNTSLAEFGAVPYSKGIWYEAESNCLLKTKSGRTGHAFLKV
ncbi:MULTISPECIES: hypothetical protein [Sphingobacterium]|uniref:hypothetical protein n=1 Tax=Sphingobacterium TaxID=28453 RepID=UPI0013DBE1B0|nr:MULTISPECIES: hypothetical protein [unclassified Sphingobacterium]